MPQDLSRKHHLIGTHSVASALNGNFKLSADQSRSIGRTAIGEHQASPTTTGAALRTEVDELTNPRHPGRLFEYNSNRLRIKHRTLSRSVRGM